MSFINWSFWSPQNDQRCRCHLQLRHTWRSSWRWSCWSRCFRQLSAGNLMPWVEILKKPGGWCHGIKQTSPGLVELHKAMIRKSECQFRRKTQKIEEQWTHEDTPSTFSVHTNHPKRRYSWIILDVHPPTWSQRYCFIPTYPWLLPSTPKSGPVTLSFTSRFSQ